MRSKFYFTQTPIHHIINLPSFVVKDSIILHLLNHPIVTCQIKPSPLSQVLITNLICPTIKMNEQIRRINKIKLHPIHHLTPHLCYDIIMQKQMNRCFVLTVSKHAPSWHIKIQYMSLCKVFPSWDTWKKEVFYYWYLLNESYGYIQSIFIVVNKLQSRSKLEYERAINQENKIKHTPVQFLDVRRL